MTGFGTPLHCAIYHRHFYAKCHLLKRCADPKSDMLLAIGNRIMARPGWLTAFIALLDAGADVDGAFNVAVDNMVVEAVEHCVQRGTVSDAKVKKEKTVASSDSSSLLKRCWISFRPSTGESLAHSLTLFKL
jgi:hypothetical protein